MKSNTAKKIEPLTVIEELNLIASMNDGLLDPFRIVDYARDPDTALHSKFTWDDGEAAHQYRLWQARQVIRLELTIAPRSEETPKEIRAFVSLRTDRKHDGTGGYRPILSVLSDDGLREQMLLDAKSEMRVFRKKYDTLRELAGVFTAMDAVL